MSDLVERLREVAERPDANYPAIMEQAAARIERQAAALRKLLGDFGHTLPAGTKDMIRAVLGEECTSS